MNNRNKVLTITAAILSFIICAEAYMIFHNKNLGVIVKNNSVDNITSSDTTESRVKTPNTQVKSTKSKKSTKVESDTNCKDLTWHAISSRNEVKTRINGTTWETVERDSYTGLWYKFVIHGDNVDQYSAKNTRNYDDPKKWNISVRWRIYGIYEPEKGLFCVALRGKEGSGIFEDIPNFISFKDDVVFYSEGDSHIFLKLVDK